jgi:hypothetical protein
MTEINESTTARKRTASDTFGKIIHALEENIYTYSREVTLACSNFFTTRLTPFNLASCSQTGSRGGAVGRGTEL